MINTEFLKAEAEKIGIHLDELALDRFDLAEQRLIRWNNHINLTAITDPDEIVIKHFIDSLAILPNVDIPQGAKIIDVGCGAGFPGLPLLFARPDLEITFLDSIRKKLGYVKEALKYAGLYGDTLHERAEIVGKNNEYRESYDFAVTRAVAPLNILVEYCLPLIKPGGLYISMKGADSEVDIAQNAVKELGGKIESVISYKLPTGDKRNLIMIRKISQTPSKYPRKSKKIDTKPL